MKTCKIFLTIAIAILFFSTAMAQESGKKAGGFGGVSFQNTNFMGEWAMEVGGIGAGYLLDGFYVGGGGFGMSQSKNDLDYSMGYGGLMLGYNLFSEKTKTSLNFNLLGGYGGISVEGGDTPDEADGFWVVKPNAEVEFRIASFMRIGVGGGYRLVMGADLPRVDNNDVSAPYGSITFRFGG
jgi:hypothetical protein